jgi:hypothetical protein
MTLRMTVAQARALAAVCDELERDVSVEVEPGDSGRVEVVTGAGYQFSLTPEGTIQVAS